MTTCDAKPLARVGGGASLRPGLSLAIRRGLRGRCPSCGEGRMFRGYLKPVECCASCGADFSHIRADDGPAWLTILVVGHLVVGLVLGVESEQIWPAWLSMTVFPLLTVAMVLGLLPLAKGVFISAIWAAEARDAETV